MHHINSYSELKIDGPPLYKQGCIDNNLTSQNGVDLTTCSSDFLPLDVSATALLVVDMQPEYWSECPAVRKDFPDFPSNISSLVETCRARNVKRIIWVRASYNYRDSPWLHQFNRLHQGRIPPVVEQSTEWEDFAAPLENELVITKTSWSSTSGNTGLLDILKNDGIESVLVCGLITSVCVQHSAFGVFEAGFRTILVTDACADRGMARHNAALALYGNYMYELRKVHCIQADMENSRLATCGDDEYIFIKGGTRNSLKRIPTSTTCLSELDDCSTIICKSLPDDTEEFKEYEY